MRAKLKGAAPRAVSIPTKHPDPGTGTHAQALDDIRQFDCPTGTETAHTPDVNV